MHGMHGNASMVNMRFAITELIIECAVVVVVVVVGSNATLTLRR